jgi:uncharacterized ferredoxin-like protein
MIFQAEQAEKVAVLTTAQAMCAAARTAPKAKGVDHLLTAIVTDDDLCALADEMDRLADAWGQAFFHRDAGNIRKSGAVVLIGYKNAARALNECCQFCGFADCKDCVEKGGRCAYTGIDLGIAVGSACSVAAQNHIDCRVMFSAGRTAMEMGILGDKAVQVLALPLSATGKSPYFDRK